MKVVSTHKRSIIKLAQIIGCSYLALQVVAPLMPLDFLPAQSYKAQAENQPENSNAQSAQQNTGNNSTQKKRNFPIDEFSPFGIGLPKLNYPQPTNIPQENAPQASVQPKVEFQVQGDEKLAAQPTTQDPMQIENSQAENNRQEQSPVEENLAGEKTSADGLKEKDIAINPLAPANALPEIALPAEEKQDKTPAAQTTPGSSVEKALPLSTDRKEDLFLLEVALAESSYQSNPSNDNRDVLITAYEKILGYYCYSDLYVSLSWEGTPNEPRCIEYINKTREIDPQNAMLTCIQSGIDSAACLTAYDLQDVAAFGTGPAAKGSSAETQLQATLSVSRNQKQIDKASNELASAIDAWHRAPTTNNQNQLDKVKSLYSTLLQLSCNISMLKLVPISAQERQEILKRKTKSNPKNDAGSLAEAIAELDRVIETKSTPEENAAAGANATNEGSKDIYAIKTSQKASAAQKDQNSIFKRIRYVSFQCKSRAEEALRIIPFFAPAVCNIEGQFAPKCIQALRKAREEGLTRSQRQPQQTQLSAPGVPAPFNRAPQKTKDSLASF